MELVDLDSPIGVEVRDVDLRVALADDEVAELLGDVRRAGTCSGSGTRRSVATTRYGSAVTSGPIAPETAGDYGVISNVDPRGVLREGALPFHSDFAFTHEPVRALSLYAVDRAGRWCPDGVRRRCRRPRSHAAALRSEIERRSVVNVYDFTHPTDRRIRERDLAPGSPVVERPLVGDHRLLGVPVVNANAMHTDRIVGLPEADSEALLAELFDHLYTPENTFVLDWSVGDLAVWDDIALQHHRPDFPATAPRTMQRVCINEKTTAELVPNIAELLAPALDI